VKNKPICSFRLASDFYRNMLDYLAADQAVTPAIILNKLIHNAVNEALTYYASKAAHEKLAIECELPIEQIRWVKGDSTSDWQRLAQNIGQEKSIQYMNQFLPVFNEIAKEIDQKHDLHFFDVSTRFEPSEADL